MADNFFDDEADELLLCFACDMEKNASESDSLAEQKMVEPEIQIPASFPFPFEPYDIQVEFMRALYKCLQLGKVGIFESPTGTGKSLSLICGALKWLRDFREQQLKTLEALKEEKECTDIENNCIVKEGPGKGLDWIQEFVEKRKKDDDLKQLKDKTAKLQPECLPQLTRKTKPEKRKRAQLENEFTELFKSAAPEIKRAYAAEMNTASEEPATDEDIILDEYFSEDDDENKESDILSDNIPAEEEHILKIYYCSRTHSQLSQFVNEVLKSPFGEDTRVVSLGSRQNLCINDSVRQLRSLSLMNDRCLELQKNKTTSRGSQTKGQRKKNKGAGCSFYKHDRLMEYKEKVLVETGDIEELVSMGKQMKCCPYYGTRYAIPGAELVALPYNTLLHKSTRDACGVQLKDNVVIIDEAHNLLDTINSIHSMQVSGAQFVRAHSQLSQYEERYRSRLRAKNLMYIKQILFILSSLVRCVGGKVGLSPDEQYTGKTESEVWTINDFLFHAQLDNLNLFKILRYCQQSQISKKLNGFVEKYKPEFTSKGSDKHPQKSSLAGVSHFLQMIAQKSDSKAPQLSSRQSSGSTNSVDEANAWPGFSSPLMHIEGLLESLTNADKDGRIIISKQLLLSQSVIKFLMLNPATQFQSVLNNARAIVVAGGTMQPVSVFKDQLFLAAGIKPDRLMEFSCGHIVPTDHLLPITMMQGPTGVHLDFTYQMRENPDLLDELGRVLCNVCNIVPGGIVCFFTSYQFEGLVHSHWLKTGLLDRIAIKKRIFREPKKATRVDAILTEYGKFIRMCLTSLKNSQTGSILFCVVGGKMSEGINFSDDLGRCIVMVGLPYPNIHSPELKEKMDYLNANFTQNSNGDGKRPSQMHYEDLCMNAVNQSIGRAIRHRDDYASIILVDRRYERTNIIERLPGWIRKHLQQKETFGQVITAVSKILEKTLRDPSRKKSEKNREHEHINTNK